MWIIISLSIIILSPRVSTGQPAWVQNYGQTDDFQITDVVSGFGISSASDTIALEKRIAAAQSRAKADLLKKLSLSIRIQSSVKTISDERPNSSDDTEIYTEIIEEHSQLKIEGIQTKLYFNDEQSPVYALALLNKKTASNRHIKKWRMLNAKYLKKTVAVDSLKSLNLELDALHTLLQADKLKVEMTNHERALRLLGTETNLSSAQAVWPDTVSSVSAAIYRIFHDVYFDLSGLQGRVHITVCSNKAPGDIKKTEHDIITSIRMHTNMNPVVPIRNHETVVEPMQAIVAASVVRARYCAYFHITNSNPGLRMQFSLYSVSDQQFVTGGKAIIMREPGAKKLSTPQENAPIRLRTNLGEDSISVVDGDTLRVYITAYRAGYIRVLLSEKNGELAVIEPGLLNCIIDGQILNREVELLGDMLLTKPQGKEKIIVLYSSQPFEPPPAFEYSFSSFPILPEDKHQKDSSRLKYSRKEIILYAESNESSINSPETAGGKAP